MTTSSRIPVCRRLVVAIVYVLFWAAPLVAQRSAAASEPAVKAAYLYQFGTYVEWPDSQNATFTICVLGQDPFGRSLDDLVKDESISGQPIAVLRVADAKDSSACRILFVSQSEDARLPVILKAVEGKPVLTVGDGAQFIRRGGMIAFTVQERKVRFAVNLAVAESAHLIVSSQLLRHAVEVRQ